MSDATKQALEQFVQKMLSGAEQAGEFAVEQAPLLVQEWLRWQVVDNAMALVVFAALAWAAWRFFRVARRWDDEAAQVVGCVAAVAAVAAGLAALESMFSLVKVLVAPRVVVLEKFMELVR